VCIHINKGGSVLLGVIFGLFVISLLLFLGAINYFFLSQKTGVYPPKKVLQQKAIAFGSVGSVVLGITIFIYILYK